MRDYPVGKAQEIALNALNLTATGYADAEQKFEKLGLVVASKRQGRRSIPSITILDRTAGDFNAEGEGVTWEAYPESDFSKIQQWVN